MGPLTASIAFTVVVATLWAAAWAAGRALVVQVRLPRADAVLVMAGAPVYSGRVAYAGRLVLDGRASKILLTNDGVRGSWSKTLQRNPLYYERATLRLREAGVPPGAIELLPGNISGTYDEAMLIGEYARTHALTSLVVVTSDFHTRRALWAVRRALRDAAVDIGIEPAVPLFTAFSPRTWCWSPRGWNTVVGEYLKLAYYCARYS